MKWNVHAFGLLIVAVTVGSVGPASSAQINLVANGSFEGAIGTTPSSWMLTGTATDGYLPVTIPYNTPGARYPFGAQGEAVPVDNASSLSPDSAGSNGVYFVSDEAKNLGLTQTIYLGVGSYDIGFDSYDTINGSQQPHDAILTANIAGVQLASFALSSVSAGSWTSHTGEAQITTAGNYLVSFLFDTPDTPANPDPANALGQYNAKDVIIDRAYVVAANDNGGTPVGSTPVTTPIGVPEPASLLSLGTFLALLLVKKVAARRIS